MRCGARCVWWDMVRVRPHLGSYESHETGFAGLPKCLAARRYNYTQWSWRSAATSLNTGPVPYEHIWVYGQIRVPLQFPSKQMQSVLRSSLNIFISFCKILGNLALVRKCGLLSLHGNMYYCYKLQHERTLWYAHNLLKKTLNELPGVSSAAVL